MNINPETIAWDILTENGIEILEGETAIETIQWALTPEQMTEYLGRVNRWTQDLITEEGEVIARKVWTVGDLRIIWSDHYGEEHPEITGADLESIIQGAASSSFRGLSDCQDWDWEALDDAVYSALTKFLSEAAKK